MASPAGTSVKALEIKLDPAKVADIEENVVITFTDLKSSWTIHIRKGAIEVVAGKASKTTAELELTRKQWAKIAMGEQTVKASVSAGKSKIKGDKNTLYKILGAFDNINIF